MGSGDTLHDFSVILIHDTEKAWLVDIVGDEGSPIWVPKSVCSLEQNFGKYNSYELTIPEWLAKEKGLI